MIVVGLEHRLAPLDLLERVTVSDADLPKALGRLRDHPNMAEVVILSTCLRTEVYAVVERFHDGVAELQEFLATASGRPSLAIEEHQTVRFDDDVASHLFSVAAGLDSAVIGESEVLGQVRRAWQRAQDGGCRRAHPRARSSVTRSKPASGCDRRRPSPEASPPSPTRPWPWPPPAQRRAARCPGHRGRGGGDGRGSRRALAGRGCDRRGRPNRTSERSEALVRRSPMTSAPKCGHAHSMTWVASSPMATCSSRPSVPATRSSIGPPWPQHSAARPSTAPMVVVDLGVPRNIEPSAGVARTVVLSDMDDLRASVADALSGRQQEVAEAEAIVGDEVEHHRVGVTGSRRRPGGLGIATAHRVASAG